MSSPPLTFEVDVREVEGLAQFMATAPERARAAMREANRLSSEDVRTQVFKNVSGSPKKKAAGGTQALGVVSGNLRRSLVAKTPKEIAGGYEGGVGVMVAYAAYHEFGYHGTVQVRAHSRQQASRDIMRGRRKVASGTANVRAHSRNVNYDGHPYARPALSARADVVMKIHADQIGLAFHGGQP